MIHTILDVTELQQARATAESYLKEGLNSYTIVDEDFNFVYASNAALLTFEATELEDIPIGLRLYVDYSEADLMQLRHYLKQLPTGELFEKNEPIQVRTAKGNIRSVHRSQRWFDKVDGSGRLLMTQFEDVTELMQTQTQLAYMVAHDELTGLLSRRGMQQRFSDGARVEDKALYVLDIDHFKSVNDSFGHEAGDTLLRTLGETMRKLSEVDGDAIRLGGEEFAIIRRWHDWEEAVHFGESLRQALEDTNVHWNNRDIHRTASIGFAPLHATDRLTDVLHLADLVAREAKSTGRNQVLGATEAMMENLRKRGVFIRADEIQVALERGEMHYEVQPIWNMKNQNIEGFEALVR